MATDPGPSCYLKRWDRIRDSVLPPMPPMDLLMHPLCHGRPLDSIHAPVTRRHLDIGLRFNLANFNMIQ